MRNTGVRVNLKSQPDLGAKGYEKRGQHHSFNDALPLPFIWQERYTFHGFAATGRWVNSVGQKGQFNWPSTACTIGLSTCPFSCSAGLTLRIKKAVYENVHSFHPMTAHSQFTDALSQPRHSTKREYAVLRLRRAIETGFYRPGQVLRQWQICTDLDLGVTPVREAIIQLCASGLIERSSHHSVKIKNVDTKWLRDIYHVRQMLETEAVRLALGRDEKSLVARLKVINRQMGALVETDRLEEIHQLDHQFHHTVFAQCPNAALLSSIEHIKSSFSVYALWRSPGRLEVSISEHDEFIRNLEAGDIDGCIKAHRHHLESGLRAAIDSAEEIAETRASGK